MKNINKLLDYSWLVILLIAALSGVFIFAMKSNTRMETDLDKYMPQKHPAFIYSNQAEELFGIKDGIIVAIENPAGIYNEGTLQKIKDLTKDIQKMDGIEADDVTSLYTADNIVGTEYGMEVHAFYKRVPQSDEELRRLREAVRTNGMIYGRLVSLDESVTIIIARIDDFTFTDEFYNRILELVDNYEGPETLYVAGIPIVEGTLARLAPQDMKTMAPIVIAVIIVVLLLILRSFKGNEHFAGTSSLNIVLEADQPDIFKEPAALRLVDSLQGDLEPLGMVGDSFSLTDFIRRMNKVMNEDGDEFNSIPDSRELIAQYLLLYEMSGDPENLSAVVDYDYKTLNVTAQLKSDDSRTIKSAIDVVEGYMPCYGLK